MINICPVKDSTSNDHRNLCSIFFFIKCFTCNDFPDFMIIIKSLQILQLIPGKSQMSACFWALDHNKICCPVITMCPHFQNKLCRSSGRNDRCYLCLIVSHQFWEIHWKSCSTDDHICTCPDRFLYMFFIVFQCDHDIYSNQSFSLSYFFCPVNMLSYCNTIASCLIFFKTFFIISYLSRRNNTNTSLCRHCSGKTASTDTNSHTSLYDWFLYCQFSYFQWL